MAHVCGRVSNGQTPGAGVGVLNEVEPMRPTRGYRVHLHNGWLIDLHVAEGTQLEFTVTTLVIRLPRQVVVPRCKRADVELVLREDGAVGRRSETAEREFVAE
jgi:hypothetical protein